LCAFRNPKTTVTAVIIKNKKILLAKRNEKPFKGMWDLPGGYMNERETPIETLRRELKEEFGVYPLTANLLGFFPGYAFWKKTRFPILSIAFRVKLPSQNLTLNEENTEVGWFTQKALPEEIAFDSNSNIIAYVKKRRFI
jgi:8-oxo-dGTP diphosphatase